MSRYQRGHIYEAFGAFHVRFYQTELCDGQLSRVQSVHVRSHIVSVPRIESTTPPSRSPWSCRAMTSYARTAESARLRKVVSDLDAQFPVFAAH
jgi:hypothetical protein